MQEVGCVIVVGCGAMLWTSWCAFRCCQGCAVIAALFVDFGGQSKFLGEWASLLFRVCPSPSLPI